MNEIMPNVKGIYGTLTNHFNWITSKISQQYGAHGYLRNREMIPESVSLEGRKEIMMNHLYKGHKWMQPMNRACKAVAQQ